MIVRGVKYRFHDVSGYYSHIPEWQDSIDISDAAIFFCDKSGASEGIYFTTEMLQRIGPLICEKKKKKDKDKKEKDKSKKSQSNKNAKNQDNLNDDNNDNIYENKELKENPIPVFILVTKGTPDLDLTDLSREVDKYLPNVKKCYGVVSDFDQNVYQAFDWLQNVLVSKKKK